ncbi:protein disulfide oxidoreductase [Methylomonas sp. LL1]|uniref:protein disulfide oxidoreductase n=1 Tax=Methylomonas sp. LL1 TaxID=2785785 RepID=UPI0018C439BE|nr:protein disulfide oxidoreductase [Methylomonas sp. LL1]QPK61993.1 protein disulfide oxidoreductase [Methylomonas sp. LL1]
MLKKSVFYIFAALFIFAGQFLLGSGLVTGQPPVIKRGTLNGNQAMPYIAHGPALLYFWAEWCGVCRTMQANVSAVLHNYPGLTVAVRSDDQGQLSAYIQQHKLDWPIVNDSDAAISQGYGARSVPALFFINQQGNIAFASAGYTSEWGLRARLWLAGLL